MELRIELDPVEKHDRTSRDAIDGGQGLPGNRSHLGYRPGHGPGAGATSGPSDRRGTVRWRCAEAARQIREQTGSPTVEFLVADLSSQAEVRRLAGEVKAATSRLDVLVNNAGLILRKREVTVDGLETTFAVNHLAYFMLTNLLIDTLKASAPSRIVNVSSAAHLGCKINFDDLQGETRYSAWRAYQQSKLANILFTHEVARRLGGTKVTANALHPGYVRTQIFRVEGFTGWLLSAPPSSLPSRRKKEQRPQSTSQPHLMWRAKPGDTSSG